MICIYKNKASKIVNLIYEIYMIAAVVILYTLIICHYFGGVI